MLWRFRECERDARTGIPPLASPVLTEFHKILSHSHFSQSAAEDWTVNWPSAVPLNRLCSGRNSHQLE